MDGFGVSQTNGPVLIRGSLDAAEGGRPRGEDKEEKEIGRAIGAENPRW